MASKRKPPPKPAKSENVRHANRQARMDGLRFIAKASMSLVAFFLLMRVPWFDQHVIVPYTGFVASFSRVLLRLLGVEASGQDALIVSPEFSVTILNVCNGVEVGAILVAVILSFPATWRARLIGIALGYPLLFLTNIFRIIVLFFLGFKQPDIFEAVHYYYAQGFVILATMAIWLLWITRFTGNGPSHNRSPAH